MKSKRVLKLLSVFIMVLSLFSSCSEKHDKKSLYEHGYDIAQTMVQKAASEQWSQVYTSSEEILEYGEKISSGSYDKPSTVYELTFNENILKREFSKADIGSMDKSLKDELFNKMPSSIPSVINGTCGSTVLAASTIYTSGKLFVDNSLKENMAYLYCFDGAYPVYVSFVKGEDGAVSASGTFIFSEDLMNNFDDKYNLKKIFGMGINIKEQEI
ncbi:MAG: hypothetical protein IJB70_08765 [Clostridia bacterium]|nr:hypothetical protein [Clostridia bacterium]